MKILVTGASSQIGQFLLPLLVEQGHTCVCVSRRKHADSQAMQWVQADMDADMQQLWDIRNINIWIHLGFLPLATSHLKAALKAGVQRFVGFSSTSIFTKKASGSDKEKQLIQSLMKAELQLQSFCQQKGLAWTLFRPTMIYGCGKDQNVAFIQKIIHQFGIFPIAGNGRGLRQPVHAEDLAFACVAVLHSDNTLNKSYNLSGGEVLSYREVVERIFYALNRPARMMSINPMIYKYMIRIMKVIFPKYAFVQTSMVDRMNMDMVFDHSDATRDFDYNPRLFQP